MSLVAGLQPPICNADGAALVKGAVPAGGLYVICCHRRDAVFSRDCGGKEIVLGGKNHSFNKHLSSTH